MTTHYSIGLNNGRQLSPIARERAPFILVAVLAIVIPHAVSLEQLPRDACLFLNHTGIPCPFCGLTHSLWAAAHGRWLWSFTSAPLGAIVYGGALLFIAVAAFEIITGKRVVPEFNNQVVGWTAVSVLSLNWVVQLVRHM